MDYKFSEIVLMKNELKVLKSLKKQDLIIKDSEIMYALLKYKLIKQVSTGVDKTWNTLLYDGTCTISREGERYLLYLKRIRDKAFEEWFRYLLTTIIAIAALAISIKTLNICPPSP